MSSHSPIVERVPLPPIENLVVEGGGVKGLAYVGALRALQDNKVLDGVIRVAGSSAGGITAMLLALGYSVEEIEKEMSNLDFTKFQDAVGMEIWRSIPESLGGDRIKKIEEFLTLARNKKHGVYKGEAFIEWAEGLIAKKLKNKDATFADLEEARKADPRQFKELMITGTNIATTGAPLKKFDAVSTPNIRIADAVRATMSYPGAFEAYEIELGERDVEKIVDGKKVITKEKIKGTFIDGGVIDNFPMDYYDDQRFLPKTGLKEGTNIRTLGLRVDTKEEIDIAKGWTTDVQQRDTQSNLKYVAAIGGAVLSDNEKVAKRGFRVIQIWDNNIDTLKFNLSAGEKKALIDSGKEAAQRDYDLYLKGAYADYIRHSNFQEKYREKTEADLLASKKALSNELSALNEQVKNSEKKGIKIDVFMHKKLEEVNLELAYIDQFLILYQKSDEKAILDKAEALLRLQKELANKNQLELEKLLEHAQQDLEAISALQEKYSSHVNMLDKLFKDEKENAELKTQLTGYFSKLQKLDKDLEEERKKIGKGIDADLPYKNLRQKTKEEIKKDIFAQIDQLVLDPKKAAVLKDLILVEIEKLGNPLREESLAFDFEAFLDNLREKQAIITANLAEMRKIMNDCETKMIKNRDYLKKLNKIDHAGEFGKIAALSNDLRAFSDNQKSIKIYLAKFGRLLLDVISVLSIVGMVIRLAAKTFWKKEFAEFEKKFYLNREIYSAKAQDLKRELDSIISKWKGAGSEQDIAKYIALLETLKEKGEKVSDSRIKTEFQKLILPALEGVKLREIKNVIDKWNSRDPNENISTHITALEKASNRIDGLPEGKGKEEIRANMGKALTKAREIEKVQNDRKEKPDTH